MSKVNVVLPDGRIVSVDEDVAAQAEGSRVHMAAPEELQSQRDAAQREETYGGASGAIAEAGISALDTATFGAAGKVASAIGGKSIDQLQQGLAAAHPTARFVGELAAMAAPTGWLGDAAKVGAEATGMGLAARAGEAVGGVAGKVAGRAVEGGLVGAGGYVAGTNASGDPLTIEGAVEGAGFGAILGVGMGAAADKLEGLTWNAKKGVAEVNELKQTGLAAAKGKAVFDDPPPSWNEFREAHEAQQAATETFNRGVEKEAAKYDAFWQSNDKLTGAIDDAQKAVNEVKNRYLADAGAIRNTAMVEGKWRSTLYPQGLGPAGAGEAAAEAPVAQSFADEVNAAARRATKFGDRKSFLSSVYDEMRAAHPELTPESFKEQLFAARKAGDITMSRADLVAAMDPELVRASEINDPGGATYHFVEAPPEAPKAAAATEADRRILVNSKAPISEEMSQRLKNYNERISKVYKMKSGGYRLDNSGKWIRDASVPADPRGALEELRSINADITKDFSKASGKLSDLPPTPRAPRPVLDVTVPKDLQGFARMHADTINKLATGLDPNSEAAAAFGRLTDDLGLERSATPNSTVADVHGTLKTYSAKLAEYEAKATERAAEEAGKPLMLKLLNRAAKYAAARTVDVGGAVGAVSRTLAGEAVGKGLNMVEDAAFGSALVAGKMGLRYRLQQLVSKYGLPAADAARKLGPVTAYLSQSFPSGARDKETDPRKLAANRSMELMGTSMNGPDLAYLAVQGMLGQPNDIAFKMHQHIVGTLQYLVSTLPRDPGTDTHMFGSKWTPQMQEAVALAHRLEAINNPLAAITRAISGDGHPAATEALWSVYPAIMNELSQEIAVAAPRLHSLTYEQASAYSQLFRTPMSGLQEPTVVATIQGLYLPKQSPAPQGSGGGGGASMPTGRPPAVNSQVAGSSVSALISQ